MAEITITLPEELKRKVENKIGLSLLVKRLIKHLEEEQEMTDWSVKLQRSTRKGRYERLKKNGAI